MKYKGLNDNEVAELRKKHGSNVIPDSEPTTFWDEFRETFSDPMIRILLAIAVIMLVMSFLEYAEIYEPIGTVAAVLIAAFVSIETARSLNMIKPEQLLKVAAHSSIRDIRIWISCMAGDEVDPRQKRLINIFNKKEN